MAELSIPAADDFPFCRAVRGPEGTLALAHKLRTLDGVDQVAPFGNELHVVGQDPDRLAASVRATIAGTTASAEEEAASLEDVFIRLMDSAPSKFPDAVEPGVKSQ